MPFGDRPKVCVRRHGVDRNGQPHADPLQRRVSGSGKYLPTYVRRVL